MEFPDHPLWDFSLEVYARPGVEPACLALQEAHGADVNVLLAVIWHGARGLRLSPAELDRLGGAVADWCERVVRPLRAVRRDMKAGLGAPAPMADALRNRVKRLELDAEHLEQLLLAQLLPGGEEVDVSPDTALAAAAANARAYLESLGVGTDDTEHLAAILAGAFPDLPAAAVATSVERWQASPG